jgi:hypothetical protein
MTASPLILTVDAARDGCSFMLSQPQMTAMSEGKLMEVAIAYGSHLFIGKEVIQGTSVRELLGLYAALSRFESNLRFCSFVVRIDCQALLHLRQGFNESFTKLYRANLYINSYGTFSLKHVTGSGPQKRSADALSRLDQATWENICCNIDQDLERLKPLVANIEKFCVRKTGDHLQEESKGLATQSAWSQKGHREDGLQEAYSKGEPGDPLSLGGGLDSAGSTCSIWDLWLPIEPEDLKISDFKSNFKNSFSTDLVCAHNPQPRPQPTGGTFLISIFTPTCPTPTISILPEPSTTWGVLGRLTLADPTPRLVWALPADPTVQVIGEDKEEEGGGSEEEGRSVRMGMTLKLNKEPK